MTNQEQTIHRYLLGEMPETERVALEEQYFSDQRLFERIVQAEKDLVDKYARGLLSSATRDRFEQHYLAHPQRRERARFAEALAVKLGEEKAIGAAASSTPTEGWWNRLVPSHGPRVAWAFSVVLLLISIVAALWFFIETRRLRQELARTESLRSMREQRERELEQEVAKEQQQAQTLSEELNRLRGEQASRTPSPARETKDAPTFATLILTIGGTRGSETGPPMVLVIPAGAEQVRLQLNLREDNYFSYQVVLQSAGGETIFTSRQLSARKIRSGGANITLFVPAQRLTAGDYILTLRGISTTGDVEDVSKSLFSVEGK